MDASLPPPTSGSLTSPLVAGPSGSGAAGAVAAPRTKSKAYQTTIAAEADDLKYESKYKELKKKVREVEEDNEQLYVKILQAQQSIQRLRLERAIVYERLAALPAPSTGGGGHHPTAQDNGSAASSSNTNAPPGPSSSGAATGGGSGNGPHHPHPLSQSFTAASHTSSSSAYNNAPPPPGSSNSSSRQPQYSPGAKRGPLLPSMDMDVDARGGGYAKGREYEYEQRSVHNGHANGMTLPPISPGPPRGHHPKAEAW